MINPLVGIIASSGGAAAAAGTYESIASATGTGSSGTITFSSIPSTYTSLQIRAMYKDVTNQGQWCQYNLRFNSDTGSNYWTHYLAGDGSAASASGFSSTRISIRYSGADSSPSADTVGVSIIDIHDYASSTRNKTVRALAGVDTNSADGGIALSSGLWLSTSAITSITVSAALSNFTANSVFALYGIKGA